ncbi:AraC family transcriptional regulator, regulatory protein of adaptative response / DNA-3-methyladenine glycosylase II [Vibrio crassostreae]|uniref:AlkA N-terminal domain-containing protein n=1 Tax=Vibrio crassostreae TaxID=246167 RepID=UPI00104D8F99|nr:AlkA N-terminal domain-containing protein [Vibrio crassostreae]TCW07479.1 DNA-3-methyladenine glycosylase II [Vibrio crassostreae]CAK3555023.1 AraC family transcriptional regulator, regulatory protein of adaptative response / DNA-3-methyladenine glycosylase II [Vibrio crassostreae]CAK3624162.1 AraC family transcriptional regulator, regulatory protein of adaptative response / DNA-3-methyladenine glycosylase II [Vibrio crassostreae]CAK3952696.1 AraC family transcriptional regulator, regulatory
MSKNINHNSTLTNEQCHLARYARDARFDGMFFTAVKTTGIFCRPICPATPPKEENVEYFSHQAQALKAGYRPCLRCRPDSAPFSPAWKGVETTFLRAMQLIDNGALNSGSIVDLATRLGISDRYLRTLFDNYIGVSPKQYSLYSQLMFAKQLLHTSSMSITDVGFASGFNSTRRFNDAFQKELQLSPSQIRRAKLSDSVSNHIQLGFHGPLDWKLLLAFYRRRMIEGLEEVGEDYYQRTVNVNGSKGWFQATLAKDNRLDIEFELDDISHLRSLIANIRRMFDLDVDIAKVEAFFETIDPNLVAKSGIRIPGVWNPWEAGVRAILGQQVSVTAAIGQLNLLVKELSDASEKAYFPTPKQIAEADVSFLRMPGSRKETLKRFAEYMVDNETEHPSKWIELKGIGPWTIQYAQLRGLSEPNHLLVGDLVVKKFIEHRPAINTQSVSPWGSYATFHCWNQS